MTFFKPLLLFCLSILLISCKLDKPEENKQAENYKLKANLSGFPEGTKFYLHNLDTNADVDSATVRNNEFTMLGHISEPPGHFWLRTTVDEKMVYTPLLIENEEVEISGDRNDFPWNLRSSGSTVDGNYRKHMNSSQELAFKRDSLIFAYHDLPAEVKESTRKEFLETVGKIDSQLRAKNISYIKTNQDTYASIMELGFYKDRLPRDTIRMIFERYPEKLQESKFGRLIKVFLESNHVEKGDPFLDFTAIDQNGEEIRLSSIMEENKFLLINYTSAYCGHCIRATKELKEVYETYGDSLNIVSFSGDPQKDDWKQSVERDGDLWPSLWDGKGRYSDSAIRYDFSSTPTFLLISPEGIIVDRWVGYNKGELSKGIGTYLDSES